MKGERLRDSTYAKFPKFPRKKKTCAGRNLLLEEERAFTFLGPGLDRAYFYRPGLVKA